jgi:hypothetical protein
VVCFMAGDKGGVGVLLECLKRRWHRCALARHTELRVMVATE